MRGPLSVTAGALFGGKHGVFFNGMGGTPDAFGVASTMPVMSEPAIAAADATTITFKNLNVVAGDVDSNGIADLIHMPAVKTYGIYTPRRAAGKGAYDWEWFGRAVTTTSALSPKINFGKDAGDIRLMDVNADGLVDAVYVSGTEVQTFFSLGRYPGGFGQFGTATWTSATTATISNDPMRACVPWAGTPVRWSDAEVKVADMNGDGLPDIVKLQKGKIEYWPGRGDGTWGTGDPTACKPGTFGSGTSIVMATSPYYTDPSVGALRVDDVNGDGLDDLVQVRFSDVDVWLNVDGLGWTDRHVIKGTPASPSYLSRTRLVDMNGSGTRDILWGDGLNYRFIDVLGGKRPWVLTKVENGLGKTTELEYATSTQLMLAAEKAGAPWQKKAPTTMHVVVKETLRDNLALAGRPPGAYVTTYSYRDPVYDGVQREFRGFSSAIVTRVGDENSPTAHTASTFLLGECKSVPGLAPDKDACQPQGAWMDDPREALKGLPTTSETYDAAGVYLQTEHHTYTLRDLYRGRDGRAVRHAFASSSDLFLYDVGAWSASASERSLAVVVAEPLSGAIETDNENVLLRSLTGRARIHSSTAVDKFGNAVASVASGCSEGCSPADEVITTTTLPALVAGDTGGWLWRTVDTFVTGSSTPGQRRRTKASYDAFGNSIKTTAVLSGTLALDRFHAVAGRSVAPAPPSASIDGEITVDETQYDSFGNVSFSAGANGRCHAIEYDSSYRDLPTTETVFVGRLTSRTSGGRTFACGDLSLNTVATYDRGIEAVAMVRDVRNELSRVDYDSFGRISAVYKPDPAGPGTTTPLPAVKIDYQLGEPISKLHTYVHDGASSTDPRYRESWAYVDGLGRTLVTLDEADPSAGDGGAWIVNGLTDYDTKGATRRAYLGWFYSGTPEAFSLAATPPTGYGSKRYDAFGRGLQTIGLDGHTEAVSVYHALSTDLWDGEDLIPGPHYGTPASRRHDGHGRTVVVTERVHNGAAVEEREVRTRYLASGEIVSLTRARVGAADAPVVRWMRHDTLGRLVLSVEPNTTKSFNSDPATDPASLKAWRYAYNDAGDLVGTSDARGCGTNYHYDAAGRLTAEDYSPCLAHHSLYSPPDFTPGAEKGIEVLNRYDFAPGDKASISAAEPECVINDALYAGRLAEVWDRGARTANVYDGRGRVTCAARKIAKPGTPSETLSERYSLRWYVQIASFDVADRPVRESTGARVTDLMGGDEKSVVTTSYTARGIIKQVAGSYGLLVASVKHDAEGNTTEIVYGDAAATTTSFDYDLKRRLRSVQTYRGPPSVWASGTITPAPVTTIPSTLQLVLEDLEYRYDQADNPIEIRDWRKPNEWPMGAQPVSKTIEYDDLYRATKVDYRFSAGSDKWVSPYEAENLGTGGAATDSRMAFPAPHVGFEKRPLWQSYAYDWLGNSSKSDDDAKGFYDRSLGAIVNGASSAGPYQLKSAATGGPRGGSLTAKYDDAGYLVSMAVRRDAETCLPHGASCSQRFVYEWDEVGRLTRARRWDLAAATVGVASDATPVASPAVDLSYQYDGGDHRTLKTAVDSASGSQRHTVYISPALELRRAAFADGEYVRSAETEVPYLHAAGMRLARVALEGSDAPFVTGFSKPRLHVFLELADHLGSTSLVVDKHTSELVENTSYLATGATEADYRPARWKAFREDHRFTGKEEDVEVGLEYFGFRYLAPALGRWISADPLSIHAGEADPNLYAYVRGAYFRLSERFDGSVAA